MRLGRRTTVFLTEKSVLRRLYNRMFNTDDYVEERHRHRYEVNPYIVPTLANKGLFFVGMGVDEKLSSENRDVHMPASASSASLTKFAAKNDANSECNSKEADRALVNKIEMLCNRGGDGVTAGKLLNNKSS